MRKPLRSRGFTLLELLVGAAVGALVLVGISLTFISQARQYQAHSNRRGLQANARQAMSFMERRLRNAGYGVDPDRAVIPYDSFDAANNGTAPGFPDAFIVHWREPLFRRVAVEANPANILLPGVIGTELRMGQILLVLCSPVAVPVSIDDFISNANPIHAFVTVGAFVPDNANIIPLDQTDPTLAPNSPLGMPGRLFHEQAILNNQCFRNAAAPPQVVLVNRAAFYVAAFDDGRGARKPYLMMHTGQDMPTDIQPNGDGTINDLDAVPVAADIEQLQVAYVLDTNVEDVADWTPIVRGVEADMDLAHYGESWAAIPLLHPNGTPLPADWFFNPFRPYPTTLFTNARDFARARLLDHPANIRQVRLTLISRSSVPDPQIPGDDLELRRDGTPYPDGPPLPGGNGRAWRHLENLALPVPAAPDPASVFKPSGGGFYRFILRQSVTPKNLLMNRQFVPVNPLGGG
jgi:type IV pilus assembly protein PilW